MSDPNEPRSVEQFELNRYLGLWYEIGRLPLRYEDDTATDVTAQYSLNDDGTIHVDNRCYDRFGEPTQALGQAEPDAEHAGRLRVTFLPAGMRWVPFTHADYWVLRIDAEYHYALVGTPNHKSLWLLAREPHIHPDVEDSYLTEAARQGYELESWIRTPQSGGRVTDDQL